MMFATLLEVRDLLKNANPEESWSIPSTLAVRLIFSGRCLALNTQQENLRVYATAFVLCPNITSYRGKLANKLMVSSLSFLRNLSHFIVIGCSSRAQSC
jgi:hypothetical protein